MLSIELASRAEENLLAIQNHPFTKEIKKLNDNWNLILTHALELTHALPGGDNHRDFIKSGQEFYGFINQLRNKIRSDLDVVNFPVWIHTFQSLLDEAELIPEDDRDFLNDEIEQLKAAYSTFTKTPNSTTTSTFIQKVNGIHTRSIEIIAQLQFLVDHLTKDTEIPPGYDRLTLVLHETSELDDIANKLLLLSKLYTETCLLLNISESEYPIIVTKVESDCLLADILGSEIVLGFLASSITAIGLLLYRTFTTEGKIGALVKQADSVKVLSEKINEMKKNGHALAESEETIDKCMVIINKKMLQLVSSQASFSVNGETHSIDNDQDKKNYLEQTQSLLEHDTIDRDNIDSNDGK